MTNKGEEMSNYFISETTYTITSDSEYKLKVQHNLKDDEVWIFIENESFRMEYEESKLLGELLIKLSNDNP